MAPDRYFEDPAIDALLQNARLVAFDLNGLILNDEPLQIAAANAVLERFGTGFTEAAWMIRFFGRRSADYFTEIMKEIGQADDLNFIRTLVAEKDRHYRGLLRQHLQDCIFPGAVTLIRHLHHRREKLLALATSASREELESIMGPPGLRLLDLFHVVVCGEDVEKGKPDPETYFQVASRSGVEPSAVLVLEDSAIGARSADVAGMPVVAVPNRFTASHDFTTVRMIISDLTPKARRIITGELK